MKPPISDSRDVDLREILLDRERGAEELLEAALSWLRSCPESLDTDRRAATLSLLRETRPAMAAFAALADQLDRDLAAIDTRDLLSTLASRLQTDGDRLVRNAVEYLISVGVHRVLTLSYSSTVAAILEAARAELSAVGVLESYPGGEGRRLVERLRRTLGSVILYPDRDLAQAVDWTDAGVIGADSVYPDGSVLNKVGSAELSRRLHEAGKPLFVLATTWKLRSAILDKGLTEEVVFESVPAKWITLIITEQGFRLPERYASASRRRQ